MITVSKLGPKKFMSIAERFEHYLLAYQNSNVFQPYQLSNTSLEIALNRLAFAVVRNRIEFPNCLNLVLKEINDPLLFFSKRLAIRLCEYDNNDISLLIVRAGCVMAITTKKAEESSEEQSVEDGKVLLFSEIHLIGELKFSHSEIINDKAINTYFLNTTTEDCSLWVDGLPNIQNNFYRYNSLGRQWIYGSILTTIPNQLKSVNSDHSISATLIIPVYGRFDLLDRLLKSIFLSPDYDRLDEVIIADDCSWDPKNLLKKICNNFGERVRIVKNKKNVGFLKNCNKSYALAKSDIVILLNSDVIVPKGWINRLLTPFEQSDIALATPLATEGENLSVNIPSGYSWKEIDEHISRSFPIYPDASTAIGYCLAIRRSTVNGRLFSIHYTHGYGEDSDLHYKITTSGYRSVVVDNLLIFHDHGASYSHHPINRENLRKENHQLFMKKWGEIYKKDQYKFESIKSLWFPQPLSELVETQPTRVLDVLFVSPSQDSRYGGVRVIFELASQLLNSGLHVGVLIDGKGDRYTPSYKSEIHPFSSFSQLRKEVTKIGVIISSSFDTIPTAEAIKLALGGHHINLAQGPEAIFSGGRYFYIYQKLINIPDKITAVSDFLVFLIKDFFDRDSEIIFYGPSSYVSYPRRYKRNLKKVAICSNDTPEKGTGFAFLLAKKLSDAGFEITTFGSSVGIPPPFVRHLGWLNSEQVSNLFSEVGFFIESSFYEGLGLLSLESVRCGALPIIRKNGSAELIFADVLDKFSWSGFHDIYTIAFEITRISMEDHNNLVDRATQISVRYEALTGFEKFHKIIKGLI
jgi:GT2 family glycosyltransferase/glycosyltransferase involved in cell wall biosynthesis